MLKLRSWLQRRWYVNAGELLLLLPLEWLYRGAIALRRLAYRRGWLHSWRAPVPVLVVGNISVGGTGKTPVAVALCAALRAAGYHPGVISRGYGARPPHVPFDVALDSPAAYCGDEPLLIARRSGCPVVIAPRRAAAARHLLARHGCDVIVCDDGLQHYALARDIEIAVIDGSRGYGNGHCLPVGPLREPAARLHEVDMVLINSELAGVRPPHNGHHWFHLEPLALTQLSSGRVLSVGQGPTALPRVHAVAGIGNPQRFFASLRQLRFEVIEHPFGDHHAFAPDDLQFGDDLPILMTEKDAMKCQAFADPRLWYLSVEARLPQSLLDAITGKLPPH